MQNEVVSVSPPRQRKRSKYKVYVLDNYTCIYERNESSLDFKKITSVGDPRDETEA